MQNTTTDLEVIRSNPRRYTWGTVTKIHDIGRYTIVEAVENEVTSFHAYADKAALGRSACSLEGALLLAIAFVSFANSNKADHRAEAAASLLNLAH